VTREDDAKLIDLSMGNYFIDNGRPVPDGFKIFGAKPPAAA
jgi:hypothetical protein